MTLRDHDLLAPGLLDEAMPKGISFTALGILLYVRDRGLATVREVLNGSGETEIPEEVRDAIRELLEGGFLVKGPLRGDRVRP